MATPCNITTYALYEDVLWHEDTGRFAYRADRPARWLQRFCLCVLRKLGCYALVKETNLKTATIDMRVMSHWLMEHCYNIQRFCGGEEIECIVMGRKQFEELAHTPVGAPYCFDLWLDYSDGGGPRWRGYKLRIVPWLDGCFALPKEKQ